MRHWLSGLLKRYKVLEIANATGISVDTIKNIRSGRTKNIKEEYLQKFADFLNMDVQKLIAMNKDHIEKANLDMDHEARSGRSGRLTQTQLNILLSQQDFSIIYHMINAYDPSEDIDGLLKSSLKNDLKKARQNVEKNIEYFEKILDSSDESS